MSRLAKCEMYHNEFIPVEDFIKCIDAVTAEEIQSLAEKIIRDEFINLTLLGPLDEQDISLNRLS